MNVQHPLKDLESNDSEIVDEFKRRLQEQFNGSMCSSFILNIITHTNEKWKSYVEYFSAKETFLLNLIYDYYLANKSLRAVDVIVAMKEPHDRHFFDRLVEFVITD